MNHIRLLIAPAILAVMLGCIAGCTNSTSSGESSDGVIPELISQARAGGASDLQISVLEQGEVSFADYEAAVNRALDCMRQSGIDVMDPVMGTNSGLRMLNYGWSPTIDGLTQEQGKALGDECLHRHSFWIETGWQAQPSSLEVKEVFFGQYRDIVVACIRDNGGTVKDDTTRGEAIRASIPVFDNTGIDCFDEAGMSW